MICRTVQVGFIVTLARKTDQATCHSFIFRIGAATLTSALSDSLQDAATLPDSSPTPCAIYRRQTLPRPTARAPMAHPAGCRVPRVMPPYRA